MGVEHKKRSQRRFDDAALSVGEETWKLHEGKLRFLEYYSLWRVRNVMLDMVTIDDGDSILDVGCGVGDFLWRLLEKADYLVGVDFAREAVKKAKRRFMDEYKSAEFVLADAEHLPFADNSFSVVLSSETIEHLPSPLGSIDEMARITQPGGELCISTPNPLYVIHPQYWPSLLRHPVRWAKRFRGKASWDSEVLDIWIWPWILRKMVEAKGLTITGHRIAQFIVDTSFSFSLTKEKTLEFLLKLCEKLEKNVVLKYLGSRQVVSAKKA